MPNNGYQKGPNLPASASKPPSWAARSPPADEITPSAGRSPPAGEEYGEYGGNLPYSTPFSPKPGANVGNLEIPG